MSEAVNPVRTEAVHIRSAAFVQRLTPRIIASLVSTGALAVLLIAASIQPAVEGYGTHTQLGMPACGWAVVSNSPCPTCGMTTAFAHAVRGDLAAAFHAQPMGLLLAIGTAMTFWAGLHIALTGSSVWMLYARLLRPRLLWLGAILAGLAWIYKWATWGAG